MVMDKCYICNEPAKYYCFWYTDTGEGGTELMQKPVCQTHYDELTKAQSVETIEILKYKQTEFVAELIALLKKYNVSIDEADNYDGEDTYGGTTYSFYGDGIDIDLNELKRLV